MFETQLQATLRAYRDDRLRYVEVPKEKRPQVRERVLLL